MFIKKKKVKIIIQGNAPLQSPKAHLLGKAETTAVAARPLLRGALLGTPTSEQPSPGPHPRTPSPSPKTSLLPSQLLLGTGDVCVPLQKLLLPHPTSDSAKLRRSHPPDPGDKWKYKSEVQIHAGALLPRTPIKP